MSFSSFSWTRILLLLIKTLVLYFPTNRLQNQNFVSQKNFKGQFQRKSFMAQKKSFHRMIWVGNFLTAKVRTKIYLFHRNLRCFLRLMILTSYWRNDSSTIIEYKVMYFSFLCVIVMMIDTCVRKHTYTYADL